MSEKLNLYQKLNEVSKSIDTLEKTRVINRNTKAFDNNDLFGPIKNTCEKFGIVCTSTFAIAKEFTALEPRQNGPSVEVAVVSGDLSITFINADNPTERETCSCSCSGKGATSGSYAEAKASAITTGRKGIYLSMFNVLSEKPDNSPQQNNNWNNAPQAPQAPQYINKAQADELITYAASKGQDVAALNSWLKTCGVDSVEKITATDFEAVKKALMATI